MKTKVIQILLVAFMLFNAMNKIIAQDFDKVNPKLNKVLVDTALVHALEVSMQPGEKSDIHSHPAHFFYALTDGILIVHYVDGKTEKFEMKAGDAGYSGPERPHMAENGGDKLLKFIIVELKEHPYKAAKMKEEMKKK